MRRLSVEINLACCGHSFDVPAVGSEIEVRFQNFRFGIVPLQLQSAQNLCGFARDCSGLQMKTQTGELHGYGRSPSPRVAGKNTCCRTHQSHGINATMLREMFVFEL